MIGSSSTTSPASTSWPSRVTGPSATATTVRAPTRRTLRRQNVHVPTASRHSTAGAAAPSFDDVRPTPRCGHPARVPRRPTMTTTDDVRTSLVTPEMLEQYRTEGYFVLERALSDEQLELLRGGAQYSIDKLDTAMDEAGVDRIGINARGKRYFSN